MFTIKRNQIEAFRAPMRESGRNKLIADLAAEDGKLDVSSDKKTIVQTDEDGNSTTLTYSNDILLSTITKPSGVRYGMGYDQEGRLSEWDFPTGEQLQFKFDNGQIKQIGSSPSKSYQFDYQKGLLSSVVYPGKKTQQFIYTDSGDLRAVIDRMGQAREFIRTPDGQLQAIKDQLNRTVQFIYDENGLLSHLVFPDKTQQSYLYDEDLDVLFVKLRDGKTFSQRYENETVKQLHWKDGPTVDFDYNKQGQPTLIKLGDHSVTFDYDDQKRLSSENSPFGRTLFQYDKSSHPSLLTLPSGLVINYDFDTDNRVTALTIGDQTTRFVYTDDLLTEIHYANGVSEYQQRNHTEGLRSARVQNAQGRLLSQQQYAYDSWDRLSHYQDSAGQQDYQLTYDDESRLTGLVGTRTRQAKERFTYDAKGNLAVFNGYPVAVGDMDEIRQIGRANVHYDALGNISRMNSRRGKLLFTFARNSTLTSVDIGSETWHYVYDGIGRRISKTNGTQQWRFTWAGSQLVTEEYQSRPGTSPIQRDYVYLPDSHVPIAFREGGQLYWIQADVRGAITHVFGPQGQLVWQASYSAFGEITIHTAQIRQPWRLIGQYEDDETGLYYNLARYYCPWLTTYLSLDPQWANPETYHYSYSRNDPYNRADPLGNLGPLLAVVAVGALVGGVVSGVVKAAEGGSFREIVGAAAHGALSGAGAAIGGIAGFAVGGPWGAYAGMVAGTGAGGFLGSLAEQIINDPKILTKCAKGALMKAADEAGQEMLFAAALGLLGKVLGPVLRPLGRKLAGTKLGGAALNKLKDAVAQVRRGVAKVRNTIKAKLRGTRLATAAEQKKLADIRANTKTKKGPNVAYAEGEIGGQALDVATISGQTQKAGLIPAKPHDQQILKTRPTASDIKKGQTNLDRRAFDTEAKILEDLLERTKNNPDVKGNIKLVSDLPVCESCADVISQFRRLRPNINVSVVETKLPDF